MLMAALAAPLARAALVALCARIAWLRDSMNILGAAAQTIAAGGLVSALIAGAPARLDLAQPMPGIGISFVTEPVGVVIAAALALMGALNAIHAVFFQRLQGAQASARLFAFSALAAAMTAGVAYSANLFTLFICYQGLILASAPLIAHGGDAAARRATRVHITTLLGCSIGLLLPAIVWTYALSGDVEFRVGGILPADISPIIASALLALNVFGFAAAALPPFHRWLALSAATPHAAFIVVAVLTVAPAGVLGVLRTTLYVFGDAMAQARVAAVIILAIAGGAMCLAALNALGKSDLRERLAYGVISQNGAGLAAIMAAAAPGYFSAILQTIAQSFAATTLAMAFATVAAATGRTAAQDMAGVGRAMPWVFAAMTVAALSFIGLPPLVGAWPRLWVVTALAEENLRWAGALIAIGSIATFAYLAPLVARGLVGEAPSDPFVRPDGVDARLIAPLVVCALATASLLFVVDPLARLLAPSWGG